MSVRILNFSIMVEAQRSQVKGCIEGGRPTFDLRRATFFFLWPKVPAQHQDAGGNDPAAANADDDSHPWLSK